MIKQVEFFAKKLARGINEAVIVMKSIIPAVKMCDKKSYFPEKKLKSKNEIIRDNLKWLLQYKEINNFYFLYGMDVADKNDVCLYKDYYHFMLDRAKGNRIKSPSSQTVILRDKLIFYKYMKSFNSPVPEVYAVYFDGRLLDTQLYPYDSDLFEKHSDFFMKSIDGECASFVKHIDSVDKLREAEKSAGNGKYLLQESIVQHSEMNRLNGCAINTLRIVTINTGKDKPFVLSSVLRVGTEKSGDVDNWAAGGLSVGINDDGYLREFGFYKPSYGTKTDIHPDSKIKFSDFRVPMYKEAVELALRSHGFFYNVHSIGWDIAITENGPVIIEGNDNWEISLMQACNKGLRKEWEDSLK